MAKKKSNNKNNEGKKNEEENKKDASGGGGGKKTAEGKEPMTVVLKTEIHCEGCASKLTKAARSFQGVESAKADMGSGKLTVVGSVDPAEVRNYLQEKTKKKVDLVSPQPKKEDKENKDKEKEDKKQGKDNKKPDADKTNNSQKPKEAQVTSGEIKMAFHCEGCIKKIRRTVSKTKGVQEMKMDMQKETVTVIGTMDIKALTEALHEKLKRNVEIVPPKKEKADGENVGGSGGNGGGKKKKGAGGEENANNGGGGEGGVVSENRMDFLMHPGFGQGYGSSMGQPVFGPGFVGPPAFGPGYVGQPVYPTGFVGQPVYGYGQGNAYGHGYGQENGYGYPTFPAHMKFNDENPNACSVM